MFYDGNAEDMPSGLGLSEKRVNELEAAIIKGLRSLPFMYHVRDLHIMAAEIAHTTEEGYYVGNLVRGYIHALEQAEAEPGLSNATICEN